MKSPIVKASLFRFLRVVAGQALGAALAAAAGGVSTLEYSSPTGVVIGMSLGALFTALDKWYRDRNKPEFQSEGA